MTWWERIHHLRRAVMQIWIGTSGYSYPDWVGDFYPRGMRPAGMLSYYTRQFPLVELNYTFYRPPTVSALATLADKTPAGFRFLVKVPQTISHEGRPDDLPSFRLAAGELARRGQLSGVLLQLPQSFHYSKGKLDWLAWLADATNDLRPAVEFRHRSWARPEMPEWLESHSLDLVSVDAPDLPGLYPPGWVQSGRRVYVRLHSRNAPNWYADGKERYNYFFADAELKEWVNAAKSAAARTDEALFLFNNCYGGQAAVNARRLTELFCERAEDWTVIAPFAETTPVQRTLFE
jgi:uncharacterized protein YecE (DUF72 family)